MNLLSRLTAPGILRFYLAFGVLLAHFHLWPCLGAWGLYVFFMLSGYWIARLWEGKYQRFRRPYLAFLLSRYWRILPVYAACTFLMFLCVWKITHRLDSWREYFNAPLWRASTTVLLGLARNPSLLVPAWSLDVEMQFYLLAPMLLWLMRWCIAPPLATFKTSAWLLAACCGFWLLPLMEQVGSYLVFFTAGVLIAITNWRPARALVVIGGCGVAAMILWVRLVHIPHQGLGNGDITFAVVDWRFAGEPVKLNHGAELGDPRRWIALAFAALAAPVVAHIVRKKSDPLDRHLGDYAYSLYMFHWIPVVMVARVRRIGMLPFQELIVVVLALAGAVLVHLLVDRPFEKWRSRFFAPRAKADEARQAGAVAAEPGAS